LPFWWFSLNRFTHPFVLPLQSFSAPYLLLFSFVDFTTIYLLFYLLFWWRFWSNSSAYCHIPIFKTPFYSLFQFFFLPFFNVFWFILLPLSIFSQYFLVLIILYNYSSSNLSMLSFFFFFSMLIYGGLNIVSIYSIIYIFLLYLLMFSHFLHRFKHEHAFWMDLLD
jgi:hypothetical protein